MKSQPSEPFRLNLADGRSFLVPHPENIAITGGGRTVIVTDPVSESVEMIDLLLVTSLSYMGDGKAA